MIILIDQVSLQPPRSIARDEPLTWLQHKLQPSLPDFPALLLTFSDLWNWMNTTTLDSRVNSFCGKRVRLRSQAAVNYYMPRCRDLSWHVPEATTSGCTLSSAAPLAAPTGKLSNLPSMSPPPCSESTVPLRQAEVTSVCVETSLGGHLILLGLKKNPPFSTQCITHDLLGFIAKRLVFVFFVFFLIFDAKETSLSQSLMTSTSCGSWKEWYRCRE